MQLDIKSSKIEGRVLIEIEHDNIPKVLSFTSMGELWSFLSRYDKIHRDISDHELPPGVDIDLPK